MTDETYAAERDAELEADANEREWEVLWHRGYSGYTTTKLTAKSKPSPEEAAQLVAIKEDETAPELTVDAVREA